MNEFLPANLPDGWRQLPLEPLVIRMSNGISKRQTKDGNGLPVSRIETISQGVIDLNRVGYLSGLSAAEVEKYRLEAGDLLFSHINSDLHLGKTAVFSTEGETLLHGMNLLLIRVDRDKILPTFVHWLFNYYRVAGLFMSIAQHAVNQSSINQKKLNALPVVVPPLPEQRRIVAEIEKQFTRLEVGLIALRRTQANLKRYRAAVLKAACEGRLVATEVELARSERSAKNSQPAYKTGADLLDRILTERRQEWHGHGKYKEPAEPKTVDLSPLPEGWAWATAQQLNLADRPCAYGVLQPGDNIPDGVPFVRVGDINDGKVDLTTLKRISAPIAAQYPRTKLQGGELAITLVGAIGRTAIIPESLAGGNTARAVGIIPLTKQVNAHWVEIWFRNPAKNAEMDSKSHEVARKTLNLEDVRIASVALPPRAEQTRIVAEVERRLSVVEELEAAVIADLQRATRLRQSILQRAFSGRLVDNGTKLNTYEPS